MKKFNGNKTVEEVKKLLEEKFGGVMDIEETIEKIDDGYTFKWFIDSDKLIDDEKFGYVYWIPRNGFFYVRNNSQETIATHLSYELDNEKWYEEILNLLYISK